MSGAPRIVASCASAPRAPDWRVPILIVLVGTSTLPWWVNGGLRSEVDFAACQPSIVPKRSTTCARAWGRANYPLDYFQSSPRTQKNRSLMTDSVLGPVASRL
jgi:hypothetical protein